MSGQRRILVVDDDKDTLKLLKNQIEGKLGYFVVTTDRPSDVLGIARSERPDLIICGIEMSERHGADVAADLAGDPDAKEIPFFFLSSLVEERDVDSDGTVGGVWMVSKSSPMTEILERIEGILDDA